jgi:hypothetical protein
MNEVFIAIVMFFSVGSLEEYVYKLSKPYGFELNYEFKELG